MILGRDPRCKLVVFTGAALMSVVIPQHSPLLYLVPALFLLVAGALTRFPLSRLLGPMALLIPVLSATALAVLLFDHRGTPVLAGSLTVTTGALARIGHLAAKSLLSVTALSILTHSTPTHELLSALRWFRVPALFVDLLQVTLRYLFMLREELARTRRAAASRGFGARWFWQAHVLGSMAGALFVRTHSRGEAIHRAMVARGYRGTLSAQPLPRPATADLLFTTATLIWFLAAWLPLSGLTA